MPEIPVVRRIVSLTSTLPTYPDSISEDLWLEMELSKYQLQGSFPSGRNSRPNKQLERGFVCYSACLRRLKPGFSSQHCIKVSAEPHACLLSPWNLGARESQNQEEPQHVLIQPGYVRLCLERWLSSERFRGTPSATQLGRKTSGWCSGRLNLGDSGLAAGRLEVLGALSELCGAELVCPQIYLLR